ncbi:MAG: nucleotidyltransferase domain-containing protein [Cyclobacteriaceae bacterium]
MCTTIESNIDNIQRLCETHGVESFSLFGSTVKGDHTTESDYDFLVRFSSSVALLDYADNYFDLLDKLESLLNKKVDLVSEKSLKNPVLIEEINKTKVSIYES